MLRWRRDEKRFIDEILLRMERSEARTAARYAKIDDSLDELNAKMDEQMRDYQANRGTLLAILDRLDRLDPPGWSPRPSRS